MRAAIRGLAWALLLQASAAASAEATVSETPGSFVLANEFVTARIEKRTGNLSSLKYKDLDLLEGGRGYWSQVGGGSRLGPQSRAAVTIDPKTNQGSRAEVSCRFAYDGQPGTLPIEVDLRYTMGRDDHGIYATAIWRHTAGQPAFSIGEARYALKLNPSIFDYMSIDAKRSRIMPTGADWDRGAPANIKEARRLTTGAYSGSVEHKYDYAAMLSETPAYGWSSTKHRVGLWIVNPSMEYIAGGPTKVELTGHLDVNKGGAPTLLNMWIGSHYGGSSLSVRQDENWTKVVGPFLLYANSDAPPDGLWMDALAQAGREADAWPYEWARYDDYPGLEARGAVRGRILLDDLPGSTMRNLQVGLAAPDYPSRRGRDVIDWQREGKIYQHWSRAADDGSFSIVKIRPGNYTLHAIADGVLGEFAKADITVKAGETLDLGSLAWKPERMGRQLWEIGTPDRSAAEFRHGDDYWHWGLYLQYPHEFPDDVNFVIGKSDPRRDWNYAQPPRLLPNGRVERPSTWRILFDLPEAVHGKATLRLGIAGSRTQRGIDVVVNDKPVGNCGPLPDTGVMHRDGIRGAWCERRVTFDAALLRPGRNVVALTVPATSWVEGVLYDYVRLELDEATP